MQSLAHRRFVGVMGYFYKLVVLGKGSPDARSKLRVIPLEEQPRSKRSHRYKVWVPPSNRESPKNRVDLEVFQCLCDVVTTWNELPMDCFPDEPSLRYFKSRVNLLDMVL